MPEKDALPKLKEKDTVIPYHSMPVWVLPTIGVGCLTAALMTAFMPVSLAHLVLMSMALPTAYFLLVETLMRLLAMMLIGALGYLAYELAHHDYLLINKNYIIFPVFFAPDLLFKRKRTWDDVCNVLIGAMVHESKSTYEYDLECSRHKKRVFIYFKSGGHVALDLNKMPKASADVLISAIESWCISFARSPQTREKVLGCAEKPWLPYGGNKKSAEVPLQIGSGSFTQMWENEMDLHFSATNFVLLEKGAKLLDGRYTIRTHLSSGGLSAVYLAETAEHDLVILKEASLPASLGEASVTKAKELFQREAKILMELNHARVARVRDIFVERGRDYLVIDYIRGESLREVAKRRGAQSERSVMEIGIQCAQILSYLHSCKPPIVHRDITPDNLILKEDGQVMLIDFGAANHYLGTATGTLIGKQCYIAPEQFRGKATVQSDIYSLGGTMHFLLTGRDPEALTSSHPASVRKDLSEEIDGIVAKMTAVDADRRVKSADDVISKIQRLIPDTVLSLSGADGR